MNHVVVAAELPRVSANRDAGLRASLNFIRPQSAKPVYYSAASTGGEPRHFYEFEAHDVIVKDMRVAGRAFSIDREGFELMRHETSVTDLYDDDAITQSYIPEAEALLADRFGATKVVIFDMTRRSDANQGTQNPDAHRGPASRVHVDYTAKSGPQRVKDFLGSDEAARLASSDARIVQINLWRPIRGPVQSSPLALADAASIKPDELIATDQVFPDRVGEIYNLAYSSAQRWYYAPLMMPHEILLIKGWDSRDDGRARFTPHGAFQLPQPTESVPPRESIEIRTLVISE